MFGLRKKPTLPSTDSTAALKLIPTALKNLGLMENQSALIGNYVFNLVLTVLKDQALIKKLYKDHDAALQDIIKS